tara:strand:+ start:614 stop:871 length:258 start_codon:yes stop_codon:yes gene_type:complete
MDKASLQQGSDDMLFDCDDCFNKITLEDCGFLGEQRHLTELIKDGAITLHDEDKLDCSPFTSLVCLCNECLIKRKVKSEKITNDK